MCAGLWRCLFPESSAHIPVGKPHLFGLKILCFHIEDAGMSEKCREAVVMVAGEPVYRKSAIACAGGSDMFAVNIGILLHVVDCCKIVAHVLTGIVTRNLGIPLGAETGEAATVGAMMI